MRQLILSAIALYALGLSLPAQAASTVFGDGSVQQCYRSAHQQAGHRGRAACDRALETGGLSRRDRAATLVNRGILLNREGRPEKAIEDFNAALRLAGPLAEAYLNRGNSHFRRGQVQAALADYTRAIDLNSSDLHVAYFNRALAYEVLERFDDARRDYERALRIKPRFAEARSRLSTLATGVAARKPRDAAAG